MVFFNDENSRILKLIRQSEKIAILTHKRPDGDAIGASLGLLHTLKKIGKDPLFFVENEPELFKRFEFLDLETHAEFELPDDPKFDLVFVLDCSNETRIYSKLRHLYHNAQKVVVFDHHSDNNMQGDCIVRSPMFSSTGILIYQFIKMAGINIDSEIAKSLYTAISTDTGGFMYGSNLVLDHIVASELGTVININKINEKLFNSRSKEDVKFLNKAIDRISFYFNDRAACIFFANGYASKEEIYSSNALDLPNFLLGIDGVEVAIVAVEIEHGKYHISIRTNNISALNIARDLEGGGHLKASGTTLYGNKEEIAKKVLKAVEEQLEKACFNE